MVIPVGLLSEQETRIADQYRRRRDDGAQQVVLLSRWRRRLAVCQAVSLGVGIAALVGALFIPTSSGVLVASTLALAMVWVGCTLFVDRVRAKLRFAQCLRDINAESIARMRRHWDRIPLTVPEVPEPWRGVADDLDLFGRASLYHLICRAHTAWGIATLRDWLLQTTSDELLDRQGAVAAMADELELRQELSARGRLLASSPAGPKEFVAWAESGTLVSLEWFLGWRVIYPAVAGLSVVLFAAGRISVDVFGSSLLALLLFNLILSALLCGRLHDVLRRLGAHGAEFYQYRSLFDLVRRAVKTHPRVLRVLGGCLETYDDATAGLGSLHRILYFSRLLRLPMIWIPIQVITLWDFHIYHYLERWRRRHGASVPAWLQGIGTLEAISSLAALAHDNPTWCYPNINDGPTQTLVAVGLAHPLQRDTVRVANDVTLGPRGTVLFVTGSNMTGKSTLLRAIGVNAILGQAGGPVCAKQFQAPRIVLATTIRVRDSLECGISLYMSELLRLKQVVEQARALREREDTVVLFLLDEILLGTNTTERHIAARAVILELIHLRALGAVSTHDLELPRDPQLAACCRNVHFSEQLIHQDGSPQLQFDYVLRPGIARSTNAIRLLEAVGVCRPAQRESNETNQDTD